MYAMQYLLCAPHSMWRTIQAQATCDRNRRVAQVSPNYEDTELRAMYPQYYR